MLLQDLWFCFPCSPFDLTSPDNNPRYPHTHTRTRTRPYTTACDCVTASYSVLRPASLSPDSSESIGVRTSATTMDAIDLTGSGSDEDDPKRRPGPEGGLGTHAAPSTAEGFATSTSGAAGAAVGTTAHPSASSSPTHRPLGQQPASSSSHNNHNHVNHTPAHASSSSSHSLPSLSSTSHSPTSHNTIHRPHSSTGSTPGFPPAYPVANTADDDVMVTGQSGPSANFGAMLGAASAAAHHQPPHLPRYPSGSYSNGAGPGPSSSSSSAGPSRANDGASAAAAIDVDSLPPAPVSRRPNPKKPVCIGAFMSRAIMLYPQSCAMAGCGPPQGSKWDLVNFRGVEMIRVKLKVSTQALH